MRDERRAEPEGEAGGDSGRAADHVFRSIAGRILSGEIADGAALPPEREIIESYGVSRTVVREAVQALANKGLVEARPRHRPVVRKPSFDTAFETVADVVRRLLMRPGGVRNLFDTRVMIEAALVRQAAKEAVKEDIAAMKAALEENRAAMEDRELFYRTDVGFHATFYAVAKNPVLPAVHRAYTAWLSPHWSNMPFHPERNRVNFEFHSEIFEAILMRDPDRAEELLRQHLAYAWNQVRAILGDA